jgi:tRNA(adenine34) deaminase
MVEDFTCHRAAWKSPMNFSVLARPRPLSSWLISYSATFLTLINNGSGVLPFEFGEDENLDSLAWTDPRHPFHVAHMEMALAEAAQAADEEEVPVGAVIVSLRRGVIGVGHNQRERLLDPTAHAEMIAITQAAQSLRSWRLERCILYVTLEPCPMCAGAIVQARLPMVVYGAADPKAGACDTLYRLTQDTRLNHRSTVLGGVLAGPCAGILSDFFVKRRQAKMNDRPG